MPALDKRHTTMASENPNKKWRWLAVLCGLLTFVVAGLFVMIGGAISKKTDIASWGIYVGTMTGVFVLFIMLIAASSESSETTSTSERSVSAASPIPTTFEELKEQADRVTYEELYRNNETYQGNLVYLRGEVIQVVADGNSNRYVLRVAITQSSYGYDDPVLVRYTGPIRLLEDDIVEIVGNVKGLHTYESVLGGQITVPEITNARLQIFTPAALEILPTFTPEPALALATPAPLPTFTPIALEILPTFTPEPAIASATPATASDLTPPTSTPEPTALHTPLPTFTPMPDSTHIPTSPPSETPTPTNATPVSPGASRNNPIPLGEQVITHDGFSLWIEEVTENATQIILNGNQFNDPPAPGNQFVMMRIKVKNNNPNPDNFRAGSRLRAVGNASVEYRQSGDGSCGVIPSEFESSRDLFQSGELTGNICFSVQSSDVASLVMYDEDGRDWIFFALR